MTHRLEKTTYDIASLVLLVGMSHALPHGSGAFLLYLQVMSSM